MKKEHTTNVVSKIHTDDRIEEVNCAMTLKEMQNFVGGCIEMVPSNQPHRALIVNEDGLGLRTSTQCKSK